MVLRNPLNGDEVSLESWQNLQVTENFEGVTATIDVPGIRPELGFVTELVTDVQIYFDRVLAYTLRIMDAEDTFTTETHEVSLTCQSYEYILSRRILFADYETKVGTVAGAIPQHEIAWQLVAYTQNFQSLGITKASNWTSSTKTQDRIIQRGKTITEAINEAATIEGGFDWWIDQNLKLHAQTPRLLFDTGLDLVWGARALTVQRSSASETYDSVVLVTGALQETTLPSGAVFPPPAPAIRQLASRPLGRWERAYSYGDLITNASVIAKADWHLADSSKKRATYRIGLAPGVWNQTIRPGGLLSLRVRSLPRLDFRVRCRIEEVSINATADGAVDVELGTRAEDAEVEITPTPQMSPNPTGQPMPTADPGGAVNVTITEPSGKSPTVARISRVEEFAAIMVDLDDRIARVERT